MEIQGMAAPGMEQMRREKHHCSWLVPVSLFTTLEILHVSQKRTCHRKTYLGQVRHCINKSGGFLRHKIKRCFTLVVSSQCLLARSTCVSRGHRIPTAGFKETWAQWLFKGFWKLQSSAPKWTAGVYHAALSDTRMAFLRKKWTHSLLFSSSLRLLPA